MTFTDWLARCPLVAILRGLTPADAVPVGEAAVDLNQGAVRLSQVAIQFGASCCTHVQIELGDSRTVSMATLGSFTAVQSSTTAAGVTTFNVAKQATGRYLLIWMTELPPLAGDSGKFETMIYNVTVRGFTAGQSG